MKRIARFLNWLLAKLGLRMYARTVGWKWYGGYARVNDDFIVRGEIVDDE